MFIRFVLVLLNVVSTVSTLLHFPNLIVLCPSCWNQWILFTLYGNFVSSHCVNFPGHLPYSFTLCFHPVHPLYDSPCVHVLYLVFALCSTMYFHPVIYSSLFRFSMTFAHLTQICPISLRILSNIQFGSAMLSHL